MAYIQAPAGHPLYSMAVLHHYHGALPGKGNIRMAAVHSEKTGNKEVTHVHPSLAGE